MKKVDKLESLMLKLNKEVNSNPRNINKIKGLCKEVRKTVSSLPEKSKKFILESDFIKNIKEIEKIED